MNARGSFVILKIRRSLLQRDLTYNAFQNDSFSKQQGIFKRIVLVGQICGIELCSELEVGNSRAEVRAEARRAEPSVGLLGAASPLPAS